MKETWLDELQMIYEWDARQIFPDTASGMKSATLDVKNSYNSKVGISDGSASTRAMANPSGQMAFNSEMEEEKIDGTHNQRIVKLSKQLSSIITGEHKLDRSALFELATLKKQIENILL